jgi:uncharacterized protein with PhoU and TrkA domain
VNAVRNQHYAMLRGRARPDLKLNALKHLGIHSALELVEVEDGSPAGGESATTLNLRTRTGAIQIAVVRDGEALYQRDVIPLRPGGTVVLVGEQDALARATTLFRAPHPNQRRRPNERLSVNALGRPSPRPAERGQD